MIILRKQTQFSKNESFEFVVEDVFSVIGLGIVLTGKVISGTISLNDKVDLEGKQYKVIELRSFKKLLDRATKGDQIGIRLEGLSKKDVKRGDKLGKRTSGKIRQCDFRLYIISHTKVEIRLLLFDQGMGTTN